MKRERIIGIVSLPIAIYLTAAILFQAGIEEWIEDWSMDAILGVAFLLCICFAAVYLAISVAYQPPERFLHGQEPRFSKSQRALRLSMPAFFLLFMVLIWVLREKKEFVWPALVAAGLGAASVHYAALFILEKRANERSITWLPLAIVLLPFLWIVYELLWKWERVLSP
jgi:archaellum biogenesis protein FlaJ (TadC family)